MMNRKQRKKGLHTQLGKYFSPVIRSSSQSMRNSSDLSSRIDLIGYKSLAELSRPEDEPITLFFWFFLGFEEWRDLFDGIFDVAGL